MTLPAPFDIGDLVSVTTAGDPFAVTNPDGTSTPTDPDTVTLTIKKPDGTEQEYTYAAAQVTRVGAGVYSKNISLDQSGVWTWRWAGTGAVESAAEGSFLVRRSAIVDA